MYFINSLITTHINDFNIFQNIILKNKFKNLKKYNL